VAGIRVVALVRDLITASKIESAVAGSGATLARIESPSQLPPATDVDILVVDWGDRQPEWSTAIAAWRNGATAGQGPKVILFGPHTDLAAHAAAKEAGLGPMKARSVFFGSLLELLERPRHSA
jgi:hypothetical protein